MKAETMTVTMPKGKYFIGDPCYAIPDHNVWMAMLETCDFFQGSPIGTLPDGTKVLGFGTAWGDGCYSDQYSNRYMVDAGLIGLVPVSAIPEGCDLEELGTIVEFGEAFVCEREPGGSRGTLKFGGIVIETDTEDEDVDDDEGYYADDLYEDEDED